MINPAAPALLPYMPSYGEIPWDRLCAAVGEATGAGQDWKPSQEGYIGHAMTGINMNSLNRIVSMFVNEALLSRAATTQVGEVLSLNEMWSRAGREPYKFHPDASHVSPDYRDGWNHAIDAVAKYAPSQPVAPVVPDGFDFRAHLQRQREWSELTFGPGMRTAGVCDHIRNELREVEADPSDLAEWIDVVILALDGAWRCGGSPEQIIAGIVAKQTKNEGRTWPDWRTMPADKAIEHVKGEG